MLDRVRVPRDCLLLHPNVSFIAIPLTLVWLDRRLLLPRLPGGSWRRIGGASVLFGSVLMSWSGWLFISRGRGTPDPKNPPQVLVQEGPFKYTRNPLVISGLLVLAGAGLLARSLLLLLYVPVFASVLHLVHVRTEEPELVERFGQEYLDYQQRVPRWLPRFPALSRQ